MSYQPRRPLDSARKRMVTRQQCSDLISYGQITTRLSFARTTQRYFEKLITLSKTNDLVSKRKAYSIVLRTSKHTRQELVQKLFEELGKKYQNRKGGYTRLLKTPKGFLVQLV
ncbi:50S ribosomal protein L17 [Mycoplasma suis]|uniref:50S ribosomal protein L17 n=3 Tax=Mycoplasma suis TaxID=57372 RepID=F0QR74_MYCSL|nr:50S ribosomal protein L17 [Mycoplasma suis]ADX97994.1 50S ribosomal protein L17 [Mycoplasma suis str. Illinois]AEK25129.1 50S ribosomal L17 superfamily protein [Mycoplasma suis]CBZ40491.1 50S ribosomal protein L17 [Mycoplasma suis KI3806]